MKKIIHHYTLITFVITVSIILSACGSSESGATPSLSAESIQTQAVSTFAAGLTQTALAQPTETPTQTETPTPTSTSSPAQTETPTATISSAGIIPTSTCYSMAFVADVTIPDNTTMVSSNNFTKTWRVRNNGSCAWDAGFKLAFIGGEAMNGSTLTLDALSSGIETDLSIALTAPATAGTYSGTWKMSNISGTYFGDELYVIIVVSGTASPTATLAETETPTATSEP